MVLSRIPPLARLIAGRYQDIFRDTGISYSMLCLLIAMTLCGIPSLSRFVRFVCFSPSVSSMSRAIGKFDDITMNRAMRRLAWSVLKQVRASPEDWIWVVDTTSNLKRTNGMLGEGHWANSKNEVFWGQNLMVLCAVNTKTGNSIPIMWKPCLKDSERPKGTTNHDLVPELLTAMLDEGWPKLKLVMDSWFDSAALFDRLNKLGITFVIQLKSSRKPKTNPSPRSPKRLLIDIFNSLKRTADRATTRENKPREKIGSLGIRYVTGTNIWVSGSGKNAKQIQLRVAAVYNHIKERKAFGYYATNDLSASFTWCWKMSRYRWNIEVSFRDLRQGLNWGELASKTPNGANFALTVPILILGYLREMGPEKPILSQVQSIRETETMVAIDFHAENPNSRQRESLRNRIHGTPSGKKVRSTFANESKAERKSQLHWGKAA